VGAGLTGLLTATLLRRSGAEVLVLERHDVGGVTSVGSTGKLTALQGARCSNIAAQRNPAAAAAYAQAATFGVSGLRSLIEEQGIDCALTEVDDNTFATTEDGLRRCREELAAATTAGLAVEWVDDVGLPYPTRGGVRLRGQAQLDPGLLATGLAAGLPAGSVIEGCPALDVNETDDGVEVKVSGGRLLHADHVVIATLGPVHDPSLLAARCSAQRSYVVAAPHAAPPPGTYISLDDQSRSIRPATVGGQPGIVVAGEGHPVGEPGDTTPDQRWQRLEQHCTEALGGEPATHRWHAHDLVPSDGVPFIGPVSQRAHRRWVATGFQKWGISTAYVAADLIAAQIGGASKDWEELFDPRRVASSLTTEMATTAARSVRHLVGDRLRDLVNHDGHPKCTHLGCVLAFNPTDRTWDCPCHGSRYEEDGQVICGPAVRPLETGSGTEGA
jgi:glycine/D-amino acid oxidase-like deaminating enzyme